MATLETISYGGWQTCYRLANQAIDLVILGDVGLRIIRFGLRDQPNEFFEDPQTLGKTGGDEWRMYGGHRFWHAPESQPRTYTPDNQPVAVKDHGAFVRITQPIEATTGIQKELDIYLVGDSAQVKVVHRLTNHNQWAVELAPWGLSVMAGGGLGIIPLPPMVSHGGNLLPNRNLILWGYTDMTDPRWTWGKDYILLRQDPTAATPQKVGLDVRAGWTAYVRDHHLFLKTFPPVAGATYPDLGSSVELFTNAEMLEVETLAPLKLLAPQASVEHTENWFLFEGLPPVNTESDIHQAVLPHATYALEHSQF